MKALSFLLALFSLNLAFGSALPAKLELTIKAEGRHSTFTLRDSDRIFAVIERIKIGSRPVYSLYNAGGELTHIAVRTIKNIDVFTVSGEKIGGYSSGTLFDHQGEPRAIFRKGNISTMQGVNVMGVGAYGFMPFNFGRYWLLTEAEPLPLDPAIEIATAIHKMDWYADYTRPYDPDDDFLWDNKEDPPEKLLSVESLMQDLANRKQSLGLETVLEPYVATQYKIQHLQIPVVDLWKSQSDNNLTKLWTTVLHLRAIEPLLFHRQTTQWQQRALISAIEQAIADLLAPILADIK